MLSLRATHLHAAVSLRSLNVAYSYSSVCSAPRNATLSRSTESHSSSAPELGDACDDVSGPFVGCVCELCNACDDVSDVSFKGPCAWLPAGSEGC